MDGDGHVAPQVELMGGTPSGSRGILVTVRNGPSISHEALPYLFADRAVKHSSVMMRLLSHPAAPVPGRDVLVDLGELETMIVAWALWGLQRDGYLALQLAERPSGLRVAKQRLVGTGWMPPRVTITIVSPPPMDESLAAGLAAVVPVEGASVYSTIVEWSSRRFPLPVFGVVRIVRAEATDLGILQPGLEQPPWWRNRAFNRVLAASRPNGGAMSELHGTFEKSWRAWCEFGTDQPKLKDGLLRDVRKGLAGARPTFGSFPPDPGP